MPATFRPAASNAVAIPSLQAVRRESLGAGMRSGEADFSSGMGSSRVAPSLSLSLAREVYLDRRKEVRLLSEPLGRDPRESFILAKNLPRRDLRLFVVLTPFLDVYCMDITQYITLCPPPIPAKLF
jgi:hypothetical protein